LNPDILVERLIPKYANADSRFAMLEGTAFHFRDEGTGYPLFLLHGFSSSLQTWDGWVRKLTNRFRVVRFDLPGFGLTGPWKGHPPTMENYVRAVDLLAEYLKITNFALCGNSMGGHVSWEYAIAHPEKVSKLILEDAGGYPETSSGLPALKLAGIPFFGRIVKMMTTREMVAKNVELAYADKSKFTPALDERYYELIMRAGNRDDIGERMRIADPDHSGMIKSIHIPALIMWGSEDKLIPVANACLFLHDIAGSRLVIYTNVGHLPMEESPGQSVKDLIDFLTNR
jgi:pimeloyl-ACP methyl ester carboxylesterase